MAGEFHTAPLGGAEPLPRERIRGLLEEGRYRTLDLVAPVSEPDMDRVHDPLMSPLVWDLGHIAAFEELWLCLRVGGLEPLHPELLDVYDATETPRRERGELPYLRLHDAREYLADVRRRSLEVLERAPDDAFLWDMVIRHEHQHNETMLQTLALAEPGVFATTPRPWPAGPGAVDGERVLVEGGPFPAGDPGELFAYDNERPRHEVDVPGFWIDRVPVTNGAYREFVEDGGYARRELWTAEGWEWRTESGVERPLYWTGDGRERRFHRTPAIDPALPVMHVSWFEADAYARWSGARLPTELEWEKAAAWGPGAERTRRWPWGDEAPTAGRANLDQMGFGPAPAGAYPAGASAYGVLGLVGDAWEWTASPFTGYDGFEPFPYREYSEIFFGHDYRVLRGGSWATRPRVIRNTFRNWDFPGRRQIFAGFRCAVDA